MNQKDFEELSDHYSKAAQALLKEKCYIAAYYLVGLSAECILKSRISNQTKAGDFPPKETRDYYSHDIKKLLNLAELQKAADREVQSKSATGTNIQIVRQWRVDARYNTYVTKENAESMVMAVTDDKEGFNRWLTKQ